MSHMKLGRRAHKDERDLLGHNLMRTHLKVAPLPVSKLWTCSSKHLDQGPSSTCVGHGTRNFLRCAPIQTSAPLPSACDLYRKAVLLDPWSENDHEATLPDLDPGMESGTTVRAGAKALAAFGRLTRYAWAFDLQTTVEWVLTHGPVILGTMWYDSMFKPDSKGKVTISPGAQAEGGHCYLLRGVNRQTRMARFINSWGNNWADHGDFFMSFSDLERLISEDGEVCTAVQSQ
jgi:hypothetical protein